MYQRLIKLSKINGDELGKPFSSWCRKIKQPGVSVVRHKRTQYDSNGIKVPALENSSDGHVWSDAEISSFNS